MVASKIMLEGLNLEFIRSPGLSQECPPAVVTGHLQASRLEEFIEPWLEAGIIGEGKSRRKRFLLSSFHGPKRQEQAASHHRPFSLESKVEENVLQDGGLKINSRFDKTRNVGGEVELEGCIFPCPTPPILGHSQGSWSH